MKNFLLQVTVGLLLSSIGFAANPVVEKAHKSAHKIEINTLDGRSGQCSATSIAQYAFMTASHCEGPTRALTVDGKERPVYGTIGDSLDHTIYLVGGDMFLDFVSVAKKVNLDQSDEVFVFGNPGGFSDMYRHGVVAGYDKPEKPGAALLSLLFGKPEEDDKSKDDDTPKITYYDLNGFFGDSGSAIFNMDGEIVGVTSFIIEDNHEGFTMKYMGGYELKFTPEQLKQARDFVPPAGKTPVKKAKNKITLTFTSK